MSEPTPQDHIASRERTLSQMKKLNEVARAANEVPGIEIKYLVGTGRAHSKEDLGKPMTELLQGPENKTDIPLIREILGQRGNILDMTPAQIAEVADAEQQSQPDLAKRLQGASSDVGFFFVVPTVLENFKLELEASSSGNLAGLVLANLKSPGAK